MGDSGGGGGEGAGGGMRNRSCNKGCRSVNCLSFQNKWLLFSSR